MSGICYIVGAGRGFLPLEKRSGDLVISADGGYLALRSLGIVPDVHLGDFDSLDPATALPEGIEILRHPIRKDDTDTALALRYGMKRGYTEFVILGGTGGRSDHTFANYQLLLGARKAGAHIVLVGEEDITECLYREERSFRAECGKTLSVFAFGSDAHGVDILGASYELRDGTLTADNPLGVSNAFLDAPVCIAVRDGALLVFREK